MNEELNLEDFFEGFGHEASPPASPKVQTPLKPGDIDAVQVRLDDDESKLLATNPDILSEVIQRILSDHTEDFEHLCHYFVESDARYTLDEESLTIEECWMDENGQGSAHCGFTQSFYAGCRDRNVDADPCDCVLDLFLNLRERTITVSTNVPDYEREPDEF
jgi:hypothetical protein